MQQLLKSITERNKDKTSTRNRAASTVAAFVNLTSTPVKFNDHVKKHKANPNYMRGVGTHDPIPELGTVTTKTIDGELMIWRADPVDTKHDRLFAELEDYLAVSAIEGKITQQDAADIMSIIKFEA